MVKARYWILAVGLFACGTPLPAGDSSGITDEEDAKYDGTCTHRHQRCKVAGPRCCTGFCDDSGYGFGICQAPLANGAWCQTDGWCASKKCHDSTCVAMVACAAAGKSCKADADCCTAHFCENWTYAPWTCRAALPDGQSCQTDSQCQSHHCVDYVCAK